MKRSLRMMVLGSIVAGFFTCLFYLTACKTTNENYRVLVFSKTEGYRHAAAIAAGQNALFQLAAIHHFSIDTTEDAGRFNEDTLKKYSAVILLDISGAVFNEEQRVNFKRFVQAGGGVLAIHASADAERDWPWYNKLIGAYFDTHPPVQNGMFYTADKNHPANASIPDSIQRSDEFYNFQSVSPDIHVLMTLDEKTYTGGKMGLAHPAVWCQEFDGGRSFYTSWGHSKESWKEPVFLQQVWNGLHWITGENDPKPLDYSKSLPEANRFVRTVLMTKMDEPIQMAILKNGNIFVAQRRGTILLYDAKNDKSESIGTINTQSAYEDGLLGIAADPAFDKNKFLYVFYAAQAPQDSVSDYHISRFTVNGNGRLDMGSEKVLIKIPHKNADGIHTGGGMMFDPRGNGNLFITVGDNTSPRATLYAPIDERPGREIFDAQRSASNSNDLRGKILRIHPEADGTYTIPDGNLFKKGTPKTLPEIYSMGHRQPWRLSMDTKTGWLYEGEVGPDASVDSVNRGPMAYDEFNQIRGPGNFGWPYFGGDNKPYYEYDFATGVSGKAFDPAKPVNNSRLNTGIRELPPAQKSLVWYSNITPKEFPLLGRGARCGIGGPFYRKADYPNSKNALPDYYDGKWFVGEWLRDWIMVISIDEKGNYKSMEQFLPDVPVAGPMDMQVGPDGCLYVLEYGKGWFRQNNDSKLTKFEFNYNNRNPVPVIKANRVNGAIPFPVTFSSAGTRDYDNDSIKYEWNVTSSDREKRTYREANPTINFDKNGLYTITLTVKDSKGGSATKSMEITAGNSAPEVKMELTKGNKTFFFDSTDVWYRVQVNDKEDGSLTSGAIPSANVFVSMNYSAEGFNFPVIGEPTAAQRGIGIKGGMIINSNDCYHCHSINLKSVGPTFTEVAERYKTDTGAENRLAKKVIKGGNGAWGMVSMSAHPELSIEDAKKMLSFILNLSRPAPSSMPVTGKHTIKLPPRLSPKGMYVLYAGYKDKGANGVPAVMGEDAIVLRPPWVLTSKAELKKNATNVKVPNPKGEIEILPGGGAYIGYKNIDLTGISQIEVTGEQMNVLEVHIDSANGRLIGETIPLPAGAAILPDDKDIKTYIQLEPISGAHNIYFVTNGKGYSIKNYIRFMNSDTKKK
ncbi:MAG: ThuA domain-containing protein [Chitinophagaceae bacterium]